MRILFYITILFLQFCSIPAIAKTYVEQHYVRGDVVIVNNEELRLRESDGNGANYVGFKANSSLSGNQVWTLPTADGSADQVLKTDGSGNLSFVDQAGLAGAPTIQKFTSSSGTYTTPANVTWIRVRMSGGGGGGGGSGSGSPTAGGTGGSSTFGSSLLTATGGSGGIIGVNGHANASGGSCTINSPAVEVVSTTGDSGYPYYPSYNVATQYTSGGPGGAPNVLGGAGGAGGSSGASSVVNGNGGGSGCYLEAIIDSPSASYSYAVGAGGTAGSAGTGGNAGSAGAAGEIVVEEFYN